MPTKWWLINEETVGEIKRILTESIEHQDEDCESVGCSCVHTGLDRMELTTPKCSQGFSDALCLLNTNLYKTDEVPEEGRG